MVSAVRLWNKICRLESGNLTRTIFECSLQNFVSGSWESYIYDILESINSIGSFENAQEVNITQLEEKLDDIMHKEWQSKLPSKPNLRTYSFFKNKILSEPYVSCHVSKYKRSLFCQLRTGILPLEIETGRYYRPKLEDRICKICK